MLIVFFSVASPNFLPIDNIVGILQATAVNGVLALGLTFVIITGGHRPLGRHADDLLRGDGRRVPHLLGPAVSASACSRRSVTGALVRLRLRLADRQAEGAALHRHARHDDAAQGPVARHLGHQADLLQRHAGLLRDLAGLARSADSFPALPIPERGADPVLVAHRSPPHPQQTVLGRYTFALGSNEEATRLSGVNVDTGRSSSTR